MTDDVRRLIPEAALPRGWRPYRLNVRQYLGMIESGMIRDAARLELLGGIIVKQEARSDGHHFSVGSLADALRPIIPEAWFVREQKTAGLGDRWLVDPDISVVESPMTSYRDRHPRESEIVLIGEVAELAYPIDRGPKWRRYASAGIPAYWIVNLAERRVEVYTEPAGQGRSATYQNSTLFDADAEIPVTIEGREVGRVAARDILPWAEELAPSWPPMSPRPARNPIA